MYIKIDNCVEYLIKEIKLVHICEIYIVVFM